MPKAMLVADAPWVVNEVKAALAVGEWELEAVSDPAAVAGLVEERQPDAVIVDMQVGQMGGMAVIRSIRQGTESTNRPRMVLLLDRTADSFIARRAGADANVLKPIMSSDLRTALSPKPAPVGAVEEE